MKNTCKMMGSAALLVMACHASRVFAADSYEASLKAGDEQRAAKLYDAAIKEYDMAATQGANNTEQALALGKKGVVLAYGVKNYAEARAVVDKALALEDIAAVARVTALQVLAECQMKADKDFKGATETLTTAAALEGVDWAQPTIAMALGDSLRFSGQFEKAQEAFQRIPDMASADTGIKAVAYLNLGITYQYSLHETEKAKTAYARAVELKPSLKSEVDAHLAKLP